MRTAGPGPVPRGPCPQGHEGNGRAWRGGRPPCSLHGLPHGGPWNPGCQPPPRDPGAASPGEGGPHRDTDPAHLSEGSSALPEKKVVTSRHPLLPTPWTWRDTGRWLGLGPGGRLPRAPAELQSAQHGSRADPRRRLSPGRALPAAGGAGRGRGGRAAGVRSTAGPALTSERSAAARGQRKATGQRLRRVPATPSPQPPAAGAGASAWPPHASEDGGGQGPWGQEVTRARRARPGPPSAPARGDVGAGAGGARTPGCRPTLDAS